MRKLGLVGGITWVSTIDYYRYINQAVNEKLGGHNYAECIIYSVNFQQIHDNNAADDWEATFELLSKACENLKAAGAEAIVLCANTMHLLADKIEAHAKLPLINITTATAEAIRQQGLKKVALLGTQFTMERSFFKDKLRENGIEAIIPDRGGIDYIVKTIGEELHKGLIREETKQGYLSIIDTLIQQGAEGVILGCMEIPLLIKQEDVRVPVFDTTKIHSKAAVDFSLR